MRPSKLILSMLIFTMLTFSISAQTESKIQVGKIIYLEGKVELLTGTHWEAATINTPLFNTQSIKTATKSIAEISWSNGAKTTLEPASTYLVKDIFAASGSTSIASTESIFTGFKKVFRTANESKRAEEGGIRRSKAVADSLPGPDQIYWKEDREVSFEEASAYYEKGEYAKAIWAFKVFLDQKPMSSMAKYAMFAMGHSCVLVNNPSKARDIFEKFIVKYSNDDLKNQAEMVLSKLPTAD